jgi:SAM-dependent methyltransferase
VVWAGSDCAAIEALTVRPVAAEPKGLAFLAGADHGTCMAWNDVFGELAADYESWFETPLGAFVDREELAALASMLDPPEGRVLEIGAGTGHVAKFLAGLGFSVDALEPSPGMHARGEAATAGMSVGWSAGFAESLPFDDGRFDGAVFFATIEFVDEPARAVAEAFRVVRPGGWLVIGYLNALSPWTAMYRHEADKGLPPWNAAHFFVRDQLEALAGGTAEQAAHAVWLAPMAAAPYEDAEQAGRRAGNAPAFEVLRWRKV